jgi:hypothetical protein
MERTTMSTRVLDLPALAAAALRLCALLALLSAPVLAMPNSGSGDGILVGANIERTSGAGLVIVVGLQRAR